MESAEDDQRAVKTATKVWNKIVREIDKIPLEFKEMPVTRGGRVVSFKGIVFDLGILFPEFQGLTVFLCGGLNSAAAYSKSSNIIFINLLDRDSPFEDEGRWEKQMARLRIKSWSRERGNSFIHEFIHYLDGQRDGIKWPKNPPGHDDDDDAYFNSPLEFNAFYQELIADLNRSMKRDHFLKPFGEFMGIVKRKMKEFPRKPLSPRMYAARSPDEPGEKWMDKLNPNYRRKFIRRLYQYYLMRREGFGKKA